MTLISTQRCSHRKLWTSAFAEDAVLRDFGKLDKSAFPAQAGIHGCSLAKA